MQSSVFPAGFYFGEDIVTKKSEKQELYKYVYHIGIKESFFKPQSYCGAMFKFGAKIWFWYVASSKTKKISQAL